MIFADEFTRIVERARHYARQQGYSDTGNISDPEATCHFCQNQGTFRIDLSHLPFEERQKHKLYRALFPCPICEKGQAALERMSKARMNNTGLLEEYQQYTFDTFDALPDAQKKGKLIALGACRSFVESPDNIVTVEAIHAKVAPKMSITKFRDHLGVYDEYPRQHIVLYGVPGTAKTGLAAAIVNALKDKGRGVIYIRTRDMFEEIYRHQNNEEYPKSSDILDIFKGAPYLVLDEANIENVTPARLDWFESVIRHRMAQQLHTIVTCNLSPDEFERMWGIRSYAVLRSKAWWIECRGDVLRRVDPVLRD